MSDVHLAGILVVADSMNGNGRSYPKDVLKLEVQRFHSEQILSGAAFGELDHPQYISLSYSNVDPARASHQVVAVWWKGLELHGIVRLTRSGAAQKAEEILQRNGRLGASTRCWSSLAVDNYGISTVFKDCRLITFDITEQPASRCFLEPLLMHIPHVIRPLKKPDSIHVQAKSRVQQHDSLYLKASKQSATSVPPAETQ